MRTPTIKEVLLLFESEKDNIFGLSHEYIALKLNADPVKTLDILAEMEEKNILERLSGAEFILNPKDMWKI